MIYVTSDVHFMHDNIIKYCKRPFLDISKFTIDFIKMYRDHVKEEDTVYFLGDMAYGKNANFDKLKKILSVLPGHKHLVLGNHDEIFSREQLEECFETVQDYIIIKDKYLLTHYPLESTPVTSHEKISHQLLNNYNIQIIFHGHIHTRQPVQKDNILRVNCCIDYPPNNYKLLNITNLFE